MRFLMLVYVDEAHDTGPEPVTPWVTETTASGVRLLGARLRPASDATTVRVRDGEVLLTDGPFAETKEQIGGFDVIECAGLDEAVQVAARHPGAADGTIVLRQLWPM